MKGSLIILCLVLFSEPAMAFNSNPITEKANLSAEIKLAYTKCRKMASQAQQSQCIAKLQEEYRQLTRKSYARFKNGFKSKLNSQWER